MIYIQHPDSFFVDVHLCLGYNFEIFKVLGLPRKVIKALAFSIFAISHSCISETMSSSPFSFFGYFFC